MNDLGALLGWMLALPPVADAPDLPGFWSATERVRGSFSTPLDCAVATGFVSDRIGYAFAAGYEAALSALVPSLPPGAVRSFAVTEEGGNHPRAIATRLDPTEGGYVLSGRKRWSTMAPLADVIVVVAKAPESGEGRPVLRAVCVERSASGLDVRTMPPAPFVPEVPHAELSLNGVRVPSAAVLPGDGYADYVKPFRSIEDLHVQAAFAGHLCSLALRRGFPETLAERLLGRVSEARALASLDPKKDATHLALAGFLSDVERDGAEAEAHVGLLEPAERERWKRDRMLAAVAGKARELRRSRAWERLRATRAGEDDRRGE